MFKKKVIAAVLLSITLSTFTAALSASAATTSWTSDGPSTGDSAYTIIRNALGTDAIEAPDVGSSACHSGAHITETTSSPIGNAFRFILHKDNDCDVTGTTSGNQRNEIKVYQDSAASLKALEGDTFTYKWKFKIDSTMMVSQRFTHIFQLKSESGDNDHPIVTFTGAKKSGVDKFEIRHSASSTASDEIVASMNWADIIGKSVEATVTATMSNSGSLAITLKDISNNSTLLSFTGTRDMWRDGNFIRPKWGIYRNVSDYPSQLNDAIVLFADMSISNGTGGGGTGTLFYNLDASSTSYLEAETYTSNPSPSSKFVSVSCGTCSNGTYMHTPDGSGDFMAGVDNFLKYELNVSGSGTTYIHLLDYGLNSSSDSFNISLDGGSNIQVNAPTGSWGWRTSASAITLTSGTHYLYVKVREDGARVDKIAISTSSTAPTGLGGAALAPSYH
jgi:hypothetical protein